MMASRRSTRRDFLQGRSAADALADAVAPVEVVGGVPAPDESYLIRLSRRAMACQFEVLLNAGQHDGDTHAALAALDLVDALEDQLSVFRDHSDISLLNRHAAEAPISVEPRLFELLELAVRIHQQTAGAYDVTAGALSELWGFTHRCGTMPSSDDIASAMARVGTRWLELDPHTHSVRYLAAGLQINLGSIGKGHALDRCAELMTARGMRDFLWHGGNSSVLARGHNAAIEPAGGWLIGLRDPLHPERYLGQLRLCDRALATSGSGTQFFVHGGRRYGHILDPRTGWPAEGVLTCSVLAPSAAEADALSTALYVMGAQRAAEFCQRHPEIAAVMVCAGERVGSLETHVWGLGPREWIEAPQA
jgi:FAD:protein FMN transferase